MRHYIHHVPGRLRLKAPSLKGQGGRAVRIKQRLEALPGVIAVRANQATGSIIVNYDVRRQSCEALMEAFHIDGVIPRSPAAQPAGRAPAGHSIAKRIGDAVAGRVIEALVERCAIALIAALL